jgi:hypothetical protein
VTVEEHRARARRRKPALKRPRGSVITSAGALRPSEADPSRIYIGGEIATAGTFASMVRDALASAPHSEGGETEIRVVGPASSPAPARRRHAVLTPAFAAPTVA